METNRSTYPFGESRIRPVAFFLFSLLALQWLMCFYSKPSFLEQLAL